MTVLGVHLLMLLQAHGLTFAAAVGLGALVGSAQVGGPIIEMSFGKKAHPIWSLLASSVLVAVGLVLLAVLPASANAACIVLYGMGSGIRSIVRGTGRWGCSAAKAALFSWSASPCRRCWQRPPRL